MSNIDRLESWKEIAAYLGKGVRTVSRWEKTEGLPIRRHQHEKRSSVFAMKSELDAWRNQRSAEFETKPSVKPAWRPGRMWTSMAVAALLLMSCCLFWLARP
jgi:hypothetical protein